MNKMEQNQSILTVVSMILFMVDPKLVYKMQKKGILNGKYSWFEGSKKKKDFSM
jgi:hypothetical protein